MEINCQGLSIRKMYSRCMCHPGIPNRCLAVFITPRHHVNTPGPDGGHSQMKRRPWECTTFFKFISHAPERETDSTAPNRPRQQQECLHTPPRPLPSLQTSLADPMTSSGPQWLTRARWMTPTAELTAAGLRPSPIYTLLSFMFLFFHSHAQGGSVSGRNKLLFLMLGSF